jgi:drug/metabolite transporter (DMT)-like permease
LLALGYLIVFGSLIAYTAYTWLLDNVAPRIVGTYAFVNPVVAVVLGWWLLGERLDARTIAGTAVIAVGVALIVLAKSEPAKSEPAPSGLDTVAAAGVERDRGPRRVPPDQVHHLLEER